MERKSVKTKREGLNEDIFRLIYPDQKLPNIVPQFENSWPAASILMNHLLNEESTRGINIILNDFGNWECDIQYIDEVWGLTYNYADESPRKAFVMCAYLLLQDLARRKKS